MPAPSFHRRSFGAAVSRGLMTVLLVVFAVSFLAEADRLSHSDDPHGAPWLMGLCAGLSVALALLFILPPAHAWLTAGRSFQRRWWWPVWVHTGLLTFVALVFFDLVEEPRSPTKGILSDRFVIAALIAIFVVHITAYLVPGYANGLDKVAAERARAARNRRWVTVHGSRAALRRSRLALALLIPIPVLGNVPAQYFSALPAPGFARAAGLAWPVSLAFVLMLAAGALAGVREDLIDSRTGETVGTSRFRRAAKLSILIALCLVFVGPAIRTGLPWLASFLSGAAVRVIEVEVVDVGADMRCSGCDRTVLVAEPAAPQTVSRLCSLDHDNWHDLSVGDRLQVSGPAIVIGMRATEARRALAEGS